MLRFRTIYLLADVVLEIIRSQLRMTANHYNGPNSQTKFRVEIESLKYGGPISAKLSYGLTIPSYASIG